VNHVIQNTFPSYTAWLNSDPPQHVDRLKIYVGEGAWRRNFSRCGTGFALLVSSVSGHTISGSILSVLQILSSDDPSSWYWALTSSETSAMELNAGSTAFRGRLSWLKFLGASKIETFLRIVRLSTDPRMDGHNLRYQDCDLGDKLASKSMLQILGGPGSKGWEAG
jgi:hypothetical protein